MTFSELARLAHGRLESEWWRTASLMCLTVNMNRPKGKPARKPAEFNPYAPKPERRKISMAEFKELFLGKRASS